jgi:hypothetical protein
VFAYAIKDFIQVGKRAWFYVGFVFLLIIYPGNPVVGLFFSILPAFALTGYVCGNDFKYRADDFLHSLPGSLASIVGGRFLTVPIVWFIGFASALPLWALRNAFGEYLPASTLPGIAAFSLAICLIYNALYLASYYALGFQNARWTGFVFFFGLGALGPMLGGMNPSRSLTPAGIPEDLDRITAGRADPAFYLAALALGIVLYLAAYALSIMTYRRRAT